MKVLLLTTTPYVFEAVQDRLEHEFRNRGLEIQYMTNGNDALDLIPIDKRSVVITDITLPGNSLYSGVLQFGEETKLKRPKCLVILYGLMADDFTKEEKRKFNIVLDSRNVESYQSVFFHLRKAFNRV